MCCFGVDSVDGCDLYVHVDAGCNYDIDVCGKHDDNMYSGGVRGVDEVCGVGGCLAIVAFPLNMAMRRDFPLCNISTGIGKNIPLGTFHSINSLLPLSLICNSGNSGRRR